MVPGTKAELRPQELDEVTGGTGQVGTAGNDTIHAQTLHVTIDGGAGNDSIKGEYGADRLTGGDGNDTLEGGSYHWGVNDTLSGGAGNDVLVWHLFTGQHEFHGGNGVDTIQVATDFLDMNMLLGALSVDGSMFLVRHVAGNQVTFTDRDGNPASISGSIVYMDAIVHFTGIERIVLTPPP